MIGEMSSRCSKHMRPWYYEKFDSWEQTEMDSSQVRETVHVWNVIHCLLYFYEHHNFSNSCGKLDGIHNVTPDDLHQKVIEKAAPK